MFVLLDAISAYQWLACYLLMESDRKLSKEMTSKVIILPILVVRLSITYYTFVPVVWQINHFLTYSFSGLRSPPK